MINIPLLRLLGQQLITPQFSNPEELVDWMGAMQAQNIQSAKWAIGLRLKSSKIGQVEDAINNGTIVRTHIMRPTWHFVAGKNIRWLQELNRKKNERLSQGFLKTTGIYISPNDYHKSFDAIEKALRGNKSLTLNELTPLIKEHGLPATQRHLQGYLWGAEYNGIVCSGAIRGNQNTYSLIEEHVKPENPISHEEALAKISQKYFISHAPATLDDFVWWSGLNKSEAKLGIELIKAELYSEVWKDKTWLLHQNCRQHSKATDTISLLPAFDEYLLGYKDRTDIIPIEHYSKAFTNNGIFFPVIMHQGQLIGNWNLKKSSKTPSFDYSYFNSHTMIEDNLIKKATERYLNFFNYL